MNRRQNRSIRGGVSRRRGLRSTGAERLEPRQLLSVTPGWTYQAASFFDQDGDLIRVAVDGSSNASGVQIELMGGASDHADIRAIRLVDGDAQTHLKVTVERQMVGTLMSPGTSSVESIVADRATTAWGDLELDTAATLRVSLAGVDVGAIHVAMASTPTSFGAVSGFVEVKSLASIKAPGYAAGFNLMATGHIGSVEATASGLAGSIMAGGSIGRVTSRGDIVATITSGGSIAGVETLAGALKGAVIQAGGDIGDITIQPLADRAAIESSAVTAGGAIGTVKATAIRQLAITQSRFVAGERIAGASATSLGVMSVPLVGMSAAIGDTSFAAGSIGTIAANNAMNVGIGLMSVTLEARKGSIDSIAAQGPQGGLQGGWIVAPNGVGVLHGTATSWGVGIDGGSVTASHIDLVKGEGGPFGGAGIQGWKATVAGMVGALEGIATNADALAMLNVDAGSIGAVRGTVNPGSTGRAIAMSSLTARVGSIGSIEAWSGGLGGFSASGAAGGTAGNGGAGGVSSAGVSGGTGGAGGTGGKGGANAGNGGAGGAGGVSSAGTGGKAGNGGAGGITTGNGGNGGAGGAGGVSLADASGGNAGNAGSASALMAGGIIGTTLWSQGSIGAVTATTASGHAIGDSTFTAAGGDIGKSGNIWATNTGAAATDNAINNLWMKATGDIYPVTATAWGGTALSGSTLAADTDRDNVGTVWGPVATASGVHGGWSNAMQNVTATGAGIAGVTANVTNARGGTAIWNSSFTATTDIRSGGHYDDTGRIGNITVDSKAEAFAGIDGTLVQAGAGGGIGEIRVTVAGEKAILGSKFMATNFRLDQQSFTSQIGAIVVNAGRAGGANPSSGVAALAHVRSAAVGDSWFLANAGIASVDVTSVGNALSNSWLSADYDWQAYAEPMTDYMMPYFPAQNVPGRIDHVAVTVLGRFGSGFVNSKLWAEHIGTLDVKVDNQPDGVTNPGGLPLAAVAGSTFMANSGIDTVKIENAQIRGIASVNSTLKAMVPFTTQGGVRGSVFSQPGTSLLWNIAYAKPVMPAGTPTVRQLMAPKPGTYKGGDTLAVVVKFSKAVIVTGTPVIEALLPGSGKVVRFLYAGGSGSPTLAFKMTIPPGIVANQGLVFGQKLVLEGGTIKGKATGADVPLEVPALAAAVADRIRIDSTPPRLMQATVWSSSAPKGMTMITQTLMFNEAVWVAGKPNVTALVGGVSVQFTFKQGSGTKTLTFTAVVPMEVAGMAFLPQMSMSFGPGAWVKNSAGNTLDARVFSQSWMTLGATTLWR